MLCSQQVLTKIPITGSSIGEEKGLLHIQSGQGTLREPVGHDLPFAFSESDGRASLCCKRHPSIYTIAFLVGFEKHSLSVTSNTAKCN